MSAQSRQEETRRAGRPSILEGEAAGPSYGAAGDRGGDRAQSALPNGVPLRLQNVGVRPRASDDAASVTAEHGDTGMTGPGATITSNRDGSGLGGQQQEQPQAPQQPQQPSPPQQATPAARPRQTQEAANPPPRVEPHELQALRQQDAATVPQPTEALADAVQSRAHESVVRRELVQEVHVQQVEPIYGHHVHESDAEARGTTRPAWFTRMSEVIQRRVVGPVLEQVQAGRGRGLQSPEGSPNSVWHSQPSQPGTPTVPLMSQEMRQAMTSWTARPSLLTAAPRRPAEESSNGSISQEVVMEEVKRQVKAALDERESEMKRLHDENHELRQVVMALTEREFGGNDGVQGSGVLMDGSAGPRGCEPRGNPGLEHQVAADLSRPPPGLSAQSPVPGGELLGRGALGAPPGLQRTTAPTAGEHGQTDRPLPPAGLSAQSPVPGGEPLRHEDGEGRTGLSERQAAGEHGRVDRLLPPAGLSAQSPAPGGNPYGSDGGQAGHESQTGLPGISGDSGGIPHTSGEGPGLRLERTMPWWITCIYLCRACDSCNSSR